MKTMPIWGFVLPVLGVLLPEGEPFDTQGNVVRLGDIGQDRFVNGRRCLHANPVPLCLLFGRLYASPTRAVSP